MIKYFTVFTVLSFSFTSLRTNRTTKANDALNKSIITDLQKEVDCASHNMVLPKTFTNFPRTALTKVAPNAAGQLKQGTDATIAFGEDKTTAELLASFTVWKTDLSS